MNHRDLINACQALANEGVWCVPDEVLLKMLGNPDPADLEAQVEQGAIRRIVAGFLENPCMDPPLWCLEHVATFLRPTDRFYLSLECALSEWNWISQIAQCLTFLTTGEPGEYQTRYGRIVFEHTDEDPAQWEGRLQFEDARLIWVALPDKAYEDLKRANRNLDLVLPEGERGDW